MKDASRPSEDSRCFIPGTKERANYQLRVVIRVLKGRCGGKNWKGNLNVALNVKEDLLARGFPWQAKRIDYWIHRLQASQGLTLRRGGRETSYE